MASRSRGFQVSVCDGVVAWSSATGSGGGDDIRDVEILIVFAISAGGAEVSRYSRRRDSQCTCDAGSGSARASCCRVENGIVSRVIGFSDLVVHGLLVDRLAS